MLVSSDKPRSPIDLYEDVNNPSPTSREINSDVTSNGDLQPPNQHQHQHQKIVVDRICEDHKIKAPPRKRAETWVQEETGILITLRREMVGLFNTSKSNKHHWEQISIKMREKGFDRSPDMCTEKWRNLLKEFKKAKHQDKGSGKMSHYKEIEDFVRERDKKVASSTTAPSSDAKVDSFMEFTDKDFEDAGLSLASVEDNDTPSLDVERQLDHDDADTTDELFSLIWGETAGNGCDDKPLLGKVITVKYGDYTRRVGIDGTAEAIKETIRSAFRLRTRRGFWLEDEKQVVRCLDRDMPLGNYTLHVDQGIAVRVCQFDEFDLLPVNQEEKIFYTEEDYRDFLGRRGWTCLREFNGFQNIDSMDDLQPGVLYRGMR